MTRIEQAKNALARKYKINSDRMLYLDSDDRVNLEFEVDGHPYYLRATFSSTGANRIICLGEFRPFLSSEKYRKLCKVGLQKFLFGA